MLTVMCPNCRHRFPAPGCCSTLPTDRLVGGAPDCGGYYGGGLLVPRGYTSGGGCIINAPTIIHGPAIIQNSRVQESIKSNQDRGNRQNAFRYQETASRSNQTTQSEGSRHSQQSKSSISSPLAPECHITTTCDLTGGSVTITTPSIQSGGCLIQTSDSGILVQAPRIEIRPKLTNGGCFVQKRLSTSDPEEDNNLLSDEEDVEALSPEHLSSIGSPGLLFQSPESATYTLPSGCQELPGTRRSPSPRSSRNSCRSESLDLLRLQEPCYTNSGSGDSSSNSCSGRFGSRNGNQDHLSLQEHHQQPGKHKSTQDQGAGQRRSCCCCCGVVQQKVCQVHSGPGQVSSCLEGIDPGNGQASVQIRVNATVQLPPNVGQCTVNITATTESGCNASSARNRNNFHGGGLVQPEGAQPAANDNRRDETPTTPVSWLMPCPWGFDSYLLDKVVNRLCEAKRLLQISGWYHEGLSWQQSENLLKEAPVGRWLLRDSSDSRYTFAVSVQTARGPTSVRVHYFLGRFRLDAESRLALAMPLFECPIKMLEYYVEYSKRLEEQREVWVDYSGQIYSQIYLTKPLVKEVCSLSHLARLAVNKNRLPTDNLPPLIKNYLQEYPYCL
ncbi:uncharacterized protein LOC105695960 isoform X2 [Orussus abietinus]|nr:uncharacterized protein LOC105695960 isoform X2 [Orussus abietinus]